jgi:hypothetical protein
MVGDGLPGLAATDELMRRMADAIDDVDDGPVFWIALAATQWKVGRLEDRVRDRALAIIRDGGDLARWQNAAERRRRSQVLLKLEMDLLSPPRPVSKVQAKLRTTTPLRRGDVATYRLTDGRLIALRVLALVGDERDNYPIVDLADWVGTQIPANAAELPARAPRSPVGTGVLSLVQHRDGDFPGDRIEIVRRGVPFVPRPLTPSHMFSWAEFDAVLGRDFAF